MERPLALVAFLALVALLRAPPRCAGEPLLLGGQAIEKEVAALLAEPPGFLVKVGAPYAARQVLAGRRLQQRQLRGNASLAGVGDGETWRLKVDIAVDKGPYRKEHRVILQVPSAYPKKRPVVRLGSKIVHAYLAPDEEGHVSVPRGKLAAALGRDEAKSLRGLLALLHRALSRPLNKATRSAWHDNATEFMEEASVVGRYRPRRTHAEFFTVSGFDVAAAVVGPLQAALRNTTLQADPAAARAWLLDSGIVQEVIPGMVYSFRVFTPEFCQRLMEEVSGFTRTGLPAARPNSMNNYGIILNDIGMEPLMHALQDEIVQPLAAALFPAEGSELESHHAFTVRYKGDEDTHLDVHHDESDVTFNVNIFGDFEGCPLVFCGMSGAADHRRFRVAYQHRLGYAVMHSGQQRHGAEDIARGERVNLIIWSYSYNWRHSKNYQEPREVPESAPPDRRCLSYTHDRDYGRFRKYPPGKRARFFGRGWCPQRGMEYPGFVSETEVAAARRSRRKPSHRRSRGEL